MEHRCGYRRPVTVRARVRTRSGVVGTVTICEISSSGGRIECSLPLAAHSVVMLDFSVAGERGAVRESIEAEVVRSTAQGYALEWLEFASAAVRSLCRPIGQVETQSPSRPIRHRGLRSH
jgi:hypothetical protein